MVLVLVKWKVGEKAEYSDMFETVLMMWKFENKLRTKTCREKGGTCAHANAQSYARNLPSPEAIGPEIEEGAG